MKLVFRWRDQGILRCRRDWGKMVDPSVGLTVENVWQRGREVRKVGKMIVGHLSANSNQWSSFIGKNRMPVPSIHLFP